MVTKKLYETNLGDRMFGVYQFEGPNDLTTLMTDKSVEHIFGLDISSRVEPKEIKKDLTTLGFPSAIVSPRIDGEGRKFIAIIK